MTSPDRQLAERAVIEAARKWRASDAGSSDEARAGSGIFNALDALDALPSPPEPGAGTMTEDKVREISDRQIALRACDDHEILQDFERRISALERPPAAAKEEGEPMTAEQRWKRSHMYSIGGSDARDFEREWMTEKHFLREAAAIRLQTIRECDAVMAGAGFIADERSVRGKLARMMESAP